jgi:hypothetical protein
VRLRERHLEADPDVVLPAIILHDVGWAVIDERTIFEQGFGPNMMESNVRHLHEQEGVRIARELLSALEYPAALIDQIAAIIDGHDTCQAAHSLDDQLVKDADKLWRFTTTGIAVACDWFKLTPTQYAHRLEGEIIPQLFTPAAQDMARQALDEARAMLRCGVLP